MQSGPALVQSDTTVPADALPLPQLENGSGDLRADSLTNSGSGIAPRDSHVAAKQAGTLASAQQGSAANAAEEPTPAAKGKPEQSCSGSASQRPQAPRKALARPQKTPQTSTPAVATPVRSLDMQNLRVSSAIDEKQSLDAAKPRRKSQQSVGAAASDQDKFAKELRAAFDKLMQEGKITPNEAAARALDMVKLQLGL